jgi:hypothetical protein
MHYVEGKRNAVAMGRSVTDAERSWMMRAGPIRRVLIAVAAALAAVLLLAGMFRAAAGEDRGTLLKERQRLRSENAALSARLSLSKESNTYLVADLSVKKISLELQGVPLFSIPIQEVRLNKHAERLLAEGEQPSMLETPFVLQEDRWFDQAKTLALKDSSAVRSKPDTTGALMEAIRSTPVTAMLTYDRRLTVVLEGKPPQSRWQQLKERVSDWFRSWSYATRQGVLRRQSSDEIMVTLRMSPPDVRSLAPTLMEGTRLVLIF